MSLRTAENQFVLGDLSPPIDYTAHLSIPCRLCSFAPKKDGTAVSASVGLGLRHGVPSPVIRDLMLEYRHIIRGRYWTSKA